MSGIADVVATMNPYPGLRPFREEEEYLFFGRESQIDKMVDRLAANRFLTVVGTSGSGKSSLVNCGLRPALRRGLMPSAGTSWRVVQFRPGARPIHAMAAALAHEGTLFVNDEASGMPLTDLVDATLRMSNVGLADVYELARLPERTNLLVIVDQFEELFRYRAGARPEDGSFGAGEEATTFVNLLLGAHAAAFPIYVALTMRSDFLGDCSQFYGLPEAINEGQYLVPRMTRDERRAAIAGPAEVMAAEISPVLLTRLLNDTGDNPDQLSILQHALNRTWARWQHQGRGEGLLSIESYEAIGTMAHALDAHAEKAFAELRSDRQRQVCERVFKALTDRGTDPRGVRRPTSLGRLMSIADASQAEVEEVLDVFRKPSRSFLMPPVPEPLTADAIIDISHESLMRVWKRLRAWTMEEAESARVYRRIQDTAALNAAGQAGLWRDPDLQIALDWRTRARPTEEWASFYGGGLPDVLAFIDRSKGARDADQAEIEFRRRWVRWCVIPGAIVLFAMYAMAARTWRTQIESIAAAWIPGFLPPGAATVVRVLVESTLPSVPFMLAGIALATWGRRVFRQAAFPGLLAHTSQTVARPAAPAPTAKTIAATEALGTTYAGFWRRMLASVVDAALLVAFMFGTMIVLATLDESNWPVVDLLGDDETGVLSDAATAWWLALTFTVHSVYHVWCVISVRRATLGMRAARIILTDLHGDRLSASRALARHLAKVLSFYPLPIGALMQPFTRRRQMLHDLVSRAVVLNAPVSADPGGNTRPSGEARGEP